ncbi:YraN family protein [Robertkochia aurantiaca]|uniref:YraN family protein n=1 Tax=Robertkochia aurantiaca TaxID=2873700 RepID=UPI001CCC7E9F|nr:YraN family protein [Robertkochia sp. 3YJGBD-33]
MAVHNQYGKLAESLACDLVIQKGYTVLERNYRFDRAEADIIARDGDRLVCIEVKARSRLKYGLPQEAVTRSKIRQLVKVMHHFVTERDIKQEVRFDIIAVSGKGKTLEIEHIEDAFYYF